MGRLQLRRKEQHANQNTNAHVCNRFERHRMTNEFECENESRVRHAPTGKASAAQNSGAGSPGKVTAASTDRDNVSLFRSL